MIRTELCAPQSQPRLGTLPLQNLDLKLCDKPKTANLKFGSCRLDAVQTCFNAETEKVEMLKFGFQTERFVAITT